jgi:hypothetical protein
MAVYTYVQTLIELLLLFVNYAKAKVDFVGLLKIWLHAHDLRECLFGMLKGSIAIVENSNAIPKLGFLCIVSVLVEKNVEVRSVPSGQTGGRVLVGKQSKPVASRPSSDSSDLESLIRVLVQRIL